MAQNSSQNRQESLGLKSECLSFSSVLSHATACISPVATPAITIPIIFASSGNGTWLVFLIAMIGLIFVSLNINQFASRKASSGSMYTYVTLGLNPTFGIICGWILCIAYTFGGMAGLSGVVNFISVFLDTSGFHVFPFFIFAIAAGLTWFLAYRGVEITMKAILTIQFTSITITIFLILILLFRHEFVLDMAQLSLKGVSLDNLGVGSVLAVFCFIGFESVIALGEEAKKPMKTIPRAILWNMVAVGLFFVITSYVEVFSFADNQINLAKSEAPLSTLANLAGVGFVGILLSVILSVEFFIGCLACITSGARILFSMGRHGLLPKSIGNVHQRNQTPHIATTLLGLLMFLVPVLLSLLGTKAIKIYEYMGIIATYAALIAYMMISVSAPFYLYKLRKLRTQDIFISVAAVLFLLLPVIGTIYPIPPSPIDKLLYIFLTITVFGSGWLLWRCRRYPRILSEIKRDIEQFE